MSFNVDKALTAGELEKVVTEYKAFVEFKETSDLCRVYSFPGKLAQPLKDYINARFKVLGEDSNSLIFLI